MVTVNFAGSSRPDSSCQCNGTETGAPGRARVEYGATAVEVGTATFWDPRSPLRIARELARFLKREKIARVGELVDTLKL